MLGTSIVVTGGRPLQGAVAVSGAKNSALAAMAAAALSDEETTLDNMPAHTDVAVMGRILEHLGCRVMRDGRRVRVSGRGLARRRAPDELVRRLRASFYVTGVLLARLGQAEVPLPGGCPLGSRPVDFHLDGFRRLGARVDVVHGCVRARAARLVGTEIYINRASVGATINLMLAASMARGTTVLLNAAREPEVVDTAVLLNAMGACVQGAGTDQIRITGVPRLHGARHAIIPDRIEAGTFLAAAALSGGEVRLLNVVPCHLQAVIAKLREAGVDVDCGDGWVVARRRGPLRATDLVTGPYPGFPTDLHPPFAALLAAVPGISVIRETIFDRFQYVDELRRLGADLKVEGETVIIRGGRPLTGAVVEATDLRAGAALVLAGLAAAGITEIRGAELLDRGYEQLERKLAALGARVDRRVDRAVGHTEGDPLAVASTYRK